MTHPVAKSPRDVVITMRAPQAQRALIDQAADALGKTRSDFMLESAMREAERVLLDRRLFALDDADWERFNAILDAPARPTPELRKLLEARAPWDKSA